jgi:hypothetical protein
MGKGPAVVEGGLGLKNYYRGKIEELEMLIKDKSHNLRRLEAQRNELNTQGVPNKNKEVLTWLPSPHAAHSGSRMSVVLAYSVHARLLTQQG